MKNFFEAIVVIFENLFPYFKDNTTASCYKNFWGVLPFAERGESILVLKLQCFVKTVEYADTL